MKELAIVLEGLDSLPPGLAASVRDRLAEDIPAGLCKLRADLTEGPEALAAAVADDRLMVLDVLRVHPDGRVTSEPRS